MHKSEGEARGRRSRGGANCTAVGTSGEEGAAWHGWGLHCTLPPHGTVPNPFTTLPAPSCPSSSSSSAATQPPSAGGPDLPLDAAFYARGGFVYW